mgnify:CR=1 FL=1
MIKTIDTHAHYDAEEFDADRDELLTQLFAESVDSIITMGCSLKSSAAALKLAEKYERMYAAVGIHPEDCENLPDDYISQIKTLATNKKVRAIGEIGLDYHYDGFSREKQIVCFKEQLKLAQELDFPVVIHSRDATKDTLDILAEYRPRGVVHCFSGSAETAREILRLGLMISFTGVLTFKNAKKAVEACEVIPLDRIMLETDCPYMSPVPYRGERCDSSMVRFTAEKLAQIKGISTDEAILACNRNAIEFFGLTP